MTYEKDKRITGEYDPPLSERNPNPTAIDIKKLEELEEKYCNMRNEKHQD